MPSYTPPAGNAVNFNFTIPTGGYIAPLGNAVALDFNNNTGKTLAIDPGVYVLTGDNIGPLYGRILDMYDELVINGEFPVDTSSWTVEGDTGVTFTEANGYGVLTVPAGATGGFAYQVIPVVPGEAYRLEVEFGPGDHATSQVQLGTNPGFDDIYTMGGTSGTQVLDFIADTNSVVISLTESAPATISTTTTTTTPIIERVSWQQPRGSFSLLEWFALPLSEIVDIIRSSITTTTTTTVPSIDVTRSASFNKISLQRSGYYALTGSPNIGMVHGRGMSLTAGSYSLTGLPLKLVVARQFAVAPGVYALTGAVVGVLVGHKLSISPAAYNLTGLPVGLKVARKIGVTPGVYAITGNNLLITRKYIMPIAASTYALVGASVALHFGHSLRPRAGSYQLNGNPIDINYHEITKLIPDIGVYNLVGGDITFTYDRVMRPAPGSYLIQGAPLKLLATRVLAAAAGSYVLTGNAMDLIQGLATIALGNGVYRLVGGAIGMTVRRQAAFGSGTYAVTGQGFQIRAARALSVSGAYALTFPDQDPAVGRTLAIVAGSYVITGHVVSLLRKFALRSGGGVYALAGAAISTRAARKISIDPRAFQLILSTTAPVYQRRLGGPRTIAIEIAPSRYLSATSHDRTIIVGAQDRKITIGAAPSRTIGLAADDVREISLPDVDRLLSA